MPRGGSEKGLRGYGDLKGCDGAGRGDKADQTEGDVGQRHDAGAARANSSVEHWARSSVIPA